MTFCIFITALIGKPILKLWLVVGFCQNVRWVQGIVLELTITFVRLHQTLAMKSTKLRKLSLSVSEPTDHPRFL